MSYWAERSRHYRKHGGENKPHRKGNASSSTTLRPSPPPPLGELITALEMSDLEETLEDYEDSAVIKSAKTVSSYSWMNALDFNAKSAKIMIPGKPPLWTPHTGPHAPQLSEDNGTYYRDHNLARFPKHPTEPGVLACLRTDDTVAVKTNVFACGSTLGNLMRFARGQFKEMKGFRMLVEKIGNTVFLVRRENDPREIVPDVRGYGHAFPEAYTTWEKDVAGSHTNFHLVKYKFGGLHFIVRFGADGYIKKADTSESKRKNGDNFSASDPGVAEVLRLLAAENLDIGIDDDEFSQKYNSLPTEDLEVQTGGEKIDREHLFDLKTRSIKTKTTKDHLAEELPRLWIKQIPRFILAFHTRGKFESENIQVKGVREDIVKWQADHKDDLARFAALVNKIVDLASSNSTFDGKFEICQHETNPGLLEFRKQLPDAGEVLSAAVRKGWEEAAAEELKAIYDSSNYAGSEKGGDGSSDDEPWHNSAQGILRHHLGSNRRDSESSEVPGFTAC